MDVHKRGGSYTVYPHILVPGRREGAFAGMVA